MSPARSAWALYLLLLGSRQSRGCCCHITSRCHSPCLHTLSVLAVLPLCCGGSCPDASGCCAGLQLSSSTANKCWQSPNTSTLATACMATHNTWKGNGCSPAQGNPVHKQHSSMVWRRSPVVVVRDASTAAPGLLPTAADERPSGNKRASKSLFMSAHRQATASPPHPGLAALLAVLAAAG